MLALLLAASAEIVRATGQAPPSERIATLSPVAALPAHIAGSFAELTSCQQAPNGDAPTNGAGDAEDEVVDAEVVDEDRA